MSTLRIVETGEEGYTRKKWGRGFTYRDWNGQTVKDRKLRKWFKSLDIPPAWTEVWICRDQNGHILATGRDSKGRKQYRYHPEWKRRQSAKKFEALWEMGEVLPQMRERVVADILAGAELQPDGSLTGGAGGLTRSRVLAIIVRLLETTLIRIGNEEYALKNSSYGLTTLTDEHVDYVEDKIRFDFVGKSGKAHLIALSDKTLSDLIETCEELPGEALFQYETAAGQIDSISSDDVNDYLGEISGREITAKWFRTWGGSTLAIDFLCNDEMAVGFEAPDAALQDMVKFVAKGLGNTPSVAKKYYIHPAIADAYLDQSLFKLYRAAQEEILLESTILDLVRDGYHLQAEERTLMGLIKLDKAP